MVRAVSGELWRVHFQFFFYKFNVGLVGVGLEALWVANLGGDTVQLLCCQVQLWNFLVWIRRVSVFLKIFSGYVTYLGLVHGLIFFPQGALVYARNFWFRFGFI